MTQYYSTSQMMNEAGSNFVRYLDGDAGLPYVLNQQDRLYYYYSKDGDMYNLLMTSTKDLQECVE